MKKEERIKRGQSLDEINIDLAVKKLDQRVAHESPNIVNKNQQNFDSNHVEQAGKNNFLFKQSNRL